jgi:hypothetical protein
VSRVRFVVLVRHIASAATLEVLGLRQFDGLCGFANEQGKEAKRGVCWFVVWPCAKMKRQWVATSNVRHSLKSTK